MSALDSSPARLAIDKFVSIKLMFFEHRDEAAAIRFLQTFNILHLILIKPAGFFSFC